MVTIIKQIKIPDDSYKFISDKKEETDVLKNLSKINIFVGENNSGKSRFLRSIIAKKDLEFIPSDESIKLLNKDVSDLNLPEKDIFETLTNDLSELKKDSERLIINYSSIRSITPISTIIQKLNSINKAFLVPEEKNHLNSFLEYKKVIEDLKQTRGSSTGGFDHGYMGRTFNDIINDHFERWGLIDNINLTYNFDKFYIPILRGLRPLLKNANYEDVYKERTGVDYFGGYGPEALENMNINIFTGLNAYNLINLYSRGDYDKRKLINEFEEYLKDNFFDGKDVEIIASLKENGMQSVLAIKIGDEAEKPIHDLGDGLQSIIILTLPLFLHKNENLLVFIEEPEQLLHPGLQRKLIETFLHEEGFENFQFFITTHSNHLLDITLDFNNISIFIINKELDDSNNEEKNPLFTIENLSEGDTNALKLLGVRNSSVFLSNCTIWVEGITDRYYLRHYLKLYQEKHENDLGFKRYKEDYHYSFVEYGGNNITHWSFLDKEEKPINVEKLCGRLFLLADRDQGKDNRHEQLKEALGTERVHILECKEVENLISPKVLLEIVKDYEKIKDGDPLDNINTPIKYSQYKTEYLGEFIESNIIRDMEKKVRKGSYKIGSGAINDKNGFFKKVIKYTQNCDDLTDEARELTEEIYKFIDENNS